MSKQEVYHEHVKKPIPDANVFPGPQLRTLAGNLAHRIFSNQLGNLRSCMYVIFRINNRILPGIDYYKLIFP